MQSTNKPLAAASRPEPTLLGTADKLYASSTVYDSNMSQEYDVLYEVYGFCDRVDMQPLRIHTQEEPRLNSAISKSSALIEEALKQLAKPGSLPIEPTSQESAEKKGAEAWVEIYLQDEETNDIQTKANQRLYSRFMKTLP